jgi:hypothetical protein
VPPITAARRMGLSLDAFRDALPELVARGFPRADETTGNFISMPSTSGAVPAIRTPPATRQLSRALRTCRRAVPVQIIFLAEKGALASSCSPRRKFRCVNGAELAIVHLTTKNLRREFANGSPSQSVCGGPSVWV